MTHSLSGNEGLVTAGAAAGLHVFRRPTWTVVFCSNFGFALLFFLLGPYTNFASAGYLDPWIYTGYFTHFSYLVQHYGITYYVSRLPYVIPGLVMFKLFTPSVASVLLNALIAATSMTALYSAILRFYGHLPAILACIALITNPYFISGVAWDYPDGPAVAYAFIALYFFLKPTQGRVPNFLLGGAGLALSGYTNLAGLPVLLGSLAIPFWSYRRRPKVLIRQIGYIALGGIGVTLTFAVLGKPLIGTYLFFMPQINMIQYVRTHPDYLPNMWGTGYGWLPAAYRLFPVVFMLLLGGIWIRRNRGGRDALVGSYLCLLTSSVLFALFEFGFHNVGLRVFYCSTYIMAPLLTFAGLLMGDCLSQYGGGEWTERTRVPAWRSRSAWWGVALFALLLPFVRRYVVPAPSAHQVWVTLALVAAATTASIFLLKQQVVWRYALATGLLLGSLFVGPGYDAALNYVWSSQNALIFESVMKIGAVVDSGVAPDRIVRFWYDRENAPSKPPIVGKNLAGLFDSAYSLYLWGYFDFSRQLPAGPVADLRRLVDSKTTFVHLTPNPDDIPHRKELLAGRGIVTDNERRWLIHSSQGDLWVVMQDVLDDSGLH